MADDYPASDWPYTFYFNGRVLPPYSGQWHLCGLGELGAGFEDEWDQFIGLQHLWHLQCRMDHVGVIESEESSVFLVCAYAALLALVEHRSGAERAIGESMGAEGEASEIYGNIVQGLCQMIEWCDADGVALWINGYEEDRLRLEEAFLKVRDLKVPAGLRSLPHARTRASEAAGTVDGLRRQLFEFVRRGGVDRRLSKVLRRLQHV